MALPSLGAISMADYNTELKNPNGTQISMNQASFRGLAGVTTPDSTISMTSGYGKSAIKTLTRTISSLTLNYDMRADAIALGWDGTSKLDFTVTINNSVVVGSAGIGSYAFYISPTFPAGSKLTVNNYGYIVGKGGEGAKGGSYNGTAGYYPAAGAGGPAFYAGFAVNLNNGGIIGGGGGGGGGGASGLVL